MRAYQKYWEHLKLAPIDPVKAQKIINLKLPYGIMKRTIDAIRKEKNLDWDFKAENNHNPFRLHYSYVKLNEKEILTGHSIVVLTLSIDRRSDL